MALLIKRCCVLRSLNTKLSSKLESLNVSSLPLVGADIFCYLVELPAVMEFAHKNVVLPGEPHLKMKMKASNSTLNSLNGKRAHVASDLNLSPPRRARPDSSTTKQGPKTGLVTGKDIKEEIGRTKDYDWYFRFQEMDPLISGWGAEPVYRDKVTGHRISKEEFLKSKKKKEEKKKAKEIKLEWGKGLAQKREMEARLQELESEKDKPFARSRDDSELNTMLKERIRWGDPMAHLVKKREPCPILPDVGVNEKMEDSGSIIPQEIPSHSWIKRGLDAAPNHYGIRPGRHWDGVDRSKGNEKKLFKRTNEKQATEREAYLWSVSDM
ncbi:hypothetical protein T459_06634 [Capsicum annuum]|uniref:BUD13 homolog n=1 Tax=Capsicum annuum TaxID=4072 RepID=A0A2G3ABD6_CAPAN|nr:hypothetical protein T459_06634 [Capsicum annuum]